MGGMTTACGPYIPAPPTAAGPLTVETRYRWEPDEKAPEGWRSGAHWFDETVPPSVVTIWTDAPKNRSPFLHNHKFIRSHRVVEQRFVTEWKDQ